MNQIIQWLKDIGASDLDSTELKLQKSSLTLLIFPFILAAGIWSIIYYHLGFTLTALIPGTYALLSGLTLIIFAITKKYPLFRFSQLFLILILPFFVQWSLGGFVNSSAIMLWSLLSPMGALTFSGVKQAKFWFYSFALLTGISIVIDPFIQSLSKPMPPFIVIIFFGMNILLVSSFVIFNIAFFVSESSKEHDRAEKLLLNILPEKIARKLKLNQETIADSFGEVSVAFIDLVGFTSLSTKISPQSLAKCLNEIFSEFDKLVEKHGLEKIKTIGDAYMAAGGIPEVIEDHASRIALMAIDAIKTIDKLPLQADNRLSVRIGLHCGPVVAGVIGQKKFSYDLWGDTVNIASRMESQGESGKIQVSEEFQNKLKNQFNFEERGFIDIKGKGLLKTYWLLGQKS